MAQVVGQQHLRGGRTVQQVDRQKGIVLVTNQVSDCYRRFASFSFHSVESSSLESDYASVPHIRGKAITTKTGCQFCRNQNHSLRRSGGAAVRWALWGRGPDHIGAPGGHLGEGFWGQEGGRERLLPEGRQTGTDRNGWRPARRRFHRSCDWVPMRKFEGARTGLVGGPELQGLGAGGKGRGVSCRSGGPGEWGTDHAPVLRIGICSPTIVAKAKPFLSVAQGGTRFGLRASLRGRRAMSVCGPITFPGGNPCRVHFHCRAESRW